MLIHLVQVPSLSYVVLFSTISLNKLRLTNQYICKGNIEPANRKNFGTTSAFFAEVMLNNRRIRSKWHAKLVGGEVCA